MVKRGIKGGSLHSIKEEADPALPIAFCPHLRQAPVVLGLVLLVERL
jgi:hypothetical protein